MPNILITGSEGLIGKSLCLALEKIGKNVKHFDIKFSSNHNDFGDILDPDRINQKIKDCIGIIHLAAVSRVVWGEKNPKHCWQTNVVGTQNVIDAAKNSPLKPWILYASSREVYGQQQILPVEINAELMPMNIYAQSKAAAEKNILEARKAQLKTAIVRYSSVYGSVYDHNDRVVPAFCRGAILGDSLRVDGFRNILDFTHVSDTVSGTIAIINALEKGIKNLPPLHLTTGIPTTLETLAKLSYKLAGKTPNYTETPNRSYDVAKFWGNTTKTSEIINWKAKISTEEGISDLIRQFKYLLKK